MAIPLYNIKFILLISASFITIFSSIAIYFCLPILISHVIRTQISLSPSSGSYNDWRLNSVLDRIYLYNISNLDDLIGERQARHSLPQSSRPIPKLKLVGPFTFRQDREKVNIKFDTTNETVLYDQKKSWTFLPELSSVKTIDELNSTWINHINVPLAGTTLNVEYADFIDPIVAEFDLKLFLNHSANALLFEGYYDILVEQAKAAGKVDVDRFGWMHNLNNSITRGIRIFTGPSNSTLDKFGLVDQFEKTKRFDVWHAYNSETKNNTNVQCNDFRLSSAGEFFPPPEYSIISHNNNQHHGQQPKRNQNQSPVDDQQSDLKADDNKQHATDTAAMPSSPSQSPPIDHRTKLSTMNSISERPNDLQEISNKVGKTISLFMPDLCRTFNLIYNGTHNYRELSVDRYIANEFTFDYTETENSDNTESLRKQQQQKLAIDNASNNPNRCFCAYNEGTKLSSCPPNGMMELFTCRKGSPLTVSFPHFLYSRKDKSLAPYLELFEEETEPNESEHQFFMDLESTLNIPVRAQIVMQFNVYYKNEPSLNFTRDYSFLVDNPRTQASNNNNNNKSTSVFYLPQMWIKSSAEIDEQNLNNLKFIQKHIGLVTPIATISMFAFASILLMMSAKLAYDLTYGPKSQMTQIKYNFELAQRS